MRFTVNFAKSGWLLKNTHKENAPSNKTRALTKSMNIYIWEIGASNQLFIRYSLFKYG